jgi:2-keto-3-deoxy-L-rhamnonate aldolase RhmA
VPVNDTYEAVVRDPGIRRSRAPAHPQTRTGKGINEGRRGVHGAPTAAQIRGISQDEYLDKADAWPLNPNGELLLGVKLEDKYALAKAEENLKVPGIGFAEWGPGDAIDMIKEGVMVGPTSEQTAEIGREYTNRQ